MNGQNTSGNTTDGSAFQICKKNIKDFKNKQKKTQTFSVEKWKRHKKKKSDFIYLPKFWISSHITFASTWFLLCPLFFRKKKKKEEAEEKTSKHVNILKICKTKIKMFILSEDTSF